MGSNLACSLKARDPQLDVLCLDNLHRRGSELNLPRLREAGVRFVHGDIRNADDLADLPDLDVLLDCSAEPAVLAGYQSGRAYMTATNLVGTIHCLELATRHDAALIFLSTSRVYPIEHLEHLPWQEEPTRFTLAPGLDVRGASAEGIDVDFPLDGARSLYGATKLCSELLIQEYVTAAGLRAVVNRCGVIAGPWQLGKVDQGVATFWLLRHAFGGELRYVGYGGTGKQVRDFLHIDDLIDLVELQLGRIDELSGSTFNVGGGLANSLSLLELTERCQKLTGRELQIGSVHETRPGDVRIFVTDNRRTTDRLGWQPRRSVDQILSDTYTWICKHGEALQRSLASETDS